MIYQCEETTKVQDLFKNHQSTMIASCIQKVMGKIYVDDLEHPTSAVALLGDFFFVAGKVNEEMMLLIQQDFIIIIPCELEWETYIEKNYQKNIKKITRYAIKKENDIFDIKKLEGIISHLPSCYQLKLIDEAIYHYCQEHSWCRDFVSQYKDYQTYHELGIGVVILKDNQPISGASAYSRYQEGIEIEIDTLKEYRRQGLALICAAKLILECLKRHLYPSWDAHNQASVQLSQKLGYHFDHEYVAYEFYLFR